MSQIKIGFDAKKGDSFALVGSVNLPIGEFAFRSHVRDPVKGTKWPLTVTIGDEDPDTAGLFPISLEADPTVTAQWPAGSLISDIEVRDVDTNLVVHTETYSIIVKNVVTKGP